MCNTYRITYGGSLQFFVNSIAALHEVILKYITYDLSFSNSVGGGGNYHA